MELEKIKALEKELSEDLAALKEIESKIFGTLKKYADSKLLKGNERVGWLGEVYCKLLFDGQLVSDKNEHDVESKDGQRISVKTRKSNTASWNITSLIPCIDGTTCPTHLLFVLLNESYVAEKIWLFEWQYLRNNDRFKIKNVKDASRGWYVRIRKKNDNNFVIYNKGQITSREHLSLTQKPGS